jgi:hypothetical protein
MIGILSILVNNNIFGFTFTFSCLVNQFSYLQQKIMKIYECVLNVIDAKSHLIII